MASIMSTKPTDKFRQTIIVIFVLSVKWSSALFDALLMFHPSFIPRKTYTNKPFVFATSSSFSGQSRSRGSISHFPNKQHRNYIDSFAWIVGFVFFLRKFRRSRQFWNEEIYLFSLSMVCFSPVCVLLRIASVGTSFLHSLYGDATVQCTRLHDDARARVRVRVCVCVWMSAVCQFLRLLSFEYVENVNNFNICRIFIFAFIPFTFRL